MRDFRKSDEHTHEFWNGKHKREHWYVDNAIYFITARCANQFPAFASEQAKAIVWDRMDHWSKEHEFVPIIRSVLDNHHHQMGYKKLGADLGEMMRKIHGSIAKLVNDILPERKLPFWGAGRNDYFDGCLRNPRQFQRTFRYILLQSVRHRIVRDHRDYPHTRVSVEVEAALKRAIELDAFMEKMGYKRYER